ncbi:SDR family NAD(P)-dependent oxidoreductase [Thalassiella azotivora]
MIWNQRYGPWALVTGASSGIGAGFAAALAARGLHVVLAARTEHRLQDLAQRLRAEYGTSTRVLVTDLAEPGAGTALAAGVADLDVGLVVSDAGAGHPGAFLGTDLAELHRRLRLNVAAHLDLAHATLPRLAARGHGGLLLVGALGGVHGVPFMAHDSASKGYVLNLGEALHHEMRPHGVDVTVLLPGAVDTPVVDALGLERDALPVALQSVPSAVEEALRALRRGRASHVPGRPMRTLSRLLPRPVSVRLNGRMLERASQVLAARAAGT